MCVDGAAVCEGYVCVHACGSQVNTKHHPHPHFIFEQFLPETGAIQLV